MQQGGEPIEQPIAGWLYRESNLLDGVCNARFAAIQDHNLVTYRQEESFEPTKVWPLHPGCKLTPVSKKSFRIRPRHKSTLWAVAAGKYIRKDLHNFCIVWPSSHMFGRDDLRLCFEEEADARTWRSAIQDVIRELIRAEGGSGITTQLSVTESSLEVRPEPPSTAGRDDTSVSPVRLWQPSVVVGPPAPREMSPGPSQTASDSLPWYSSQKWASLRHVNGVSVYQEDEGPDGQGGAFMVSAIVRTAPAAVFKALASGKQRPFLQNMEVLKQLDPQTQIIRGDIVSKGLLAKLCAPREVVVQQTWRMESDGTYIVLVQSVDPPTDYYRMGARVLAQVVAAGFTIAPLQPQYVREGGITECLVTMVLKLDLGGWLGEASLLHNLACPLLHSLRDAFVEPMLMAVISLRDQVEQDRFVVKPFSMGRQSEPEVYEQASLMAQTLRNPTLRRTTSASTLTGSVGPRVPIATPVGEPTYEEGRDAPPPAMIPRGAGPGEADGIGDGGGPVIVNRGSCDPQYWSCPGAAGFRIRGPNYLRDRKKISADEPLFELASVDLVDAPKPTLHVAQHLPSIRDSKAPFTFVVNLMVPGPPFQALVIAWAADYDPTTDNAEESPAFDNVLARFLAGVGADADNRRSGVFKLIPSVVEGSWIIRQSVGNTPVILGRKLTTHYFRGPKYFEVDVDISSSRAAQHVVGLVKPVTTTLVIDMAILLEGHKDDELPEQLLGTVRFSRLNMKTASVPLHAVQQQAAAAR